MPSVTRYGFPGREGASTPLDPDEPRRDARTLFGRAAHRQLGAPALAGSGWADIAAPANAPVRRPAPAPSQPARPDLDDVEPLHIPRPRWAQPAFILLAAAVVAFVAVSAVFALQRSARPRSPVGARAAVVPAEPTPPRPATPRPPPASAAPPKHTAASERAAAPPSAPRAAPRPPRRARVATPPRQSPLDHPDALLPPRL